MKKRVLALALGGLGVLVAGSSAQADSIIIKLTAPPVVDGSNFDYTYDVTLDGNSNPNGQNSLASGDYTTLYDVQGLVGISNVTGMLATPVFTLFVGPITPHPPGTAPNDTVLPNIQWTYVDGGINGGVPGIDLGTFTVTLTIGTHGFLPLNYTGQDHNTLSGSVQGNIGSADVPNAAPLPSAALGGMGLLGMLAGGQYVRRRRLA